MELPARYLLAVKLFLPKSERDDVIRELSEDLQSRVEETQATLGRPLTRADESALIRRYGHPALLAGRHGARRHLIGPDIFPLYWFVLRLALAIGVAIHGLIVVALTAGGRTGPAISWAIAMLPVVAFIQFGGITLVFAVLDRYQLLKRRASMP